MFALDVKADVSSRHPIVILVAFVLACASGADRVFDYKKHDIGAEIAS
jgi:hypothetical protein